MFNPFRSVSSSDGIAVAIDRSQAVIQFGMDGTILTANENFLKTMGYSLEEVRGKHHSIFIDPSQRQTPEYRQFWEKLGRGEFDAGQYRRIGRDGSGIWLQASYNPVFDGRGKPVKVVKFATDITAQKTLMADMTSQTAAISKSQAVIEFGLDGTILNVNANFLKAVGYTLEEVKGRHHSIFVDPAERETAAYRQFWEKLRSGAYDSGQYRRIGKGGRELWLQASYNPILDADGKPYKVVKFATDVTEQVKAARIEEVVRSISRVVDAAKAHDLTERVSTETAAGDIKLLAEGVNDLLDTVSDIVSSVNRASQDSLAAAGEIAAGSSDLASRTEQQASALEQTAATIEELAASVKASAQSSRQAVQDAQSARTAAEEGGRIVSDAVEGMTRIEQASGKISAITDVIEEIAFQTNLLALNAAVEAARAGDAGKGFAVVAAEVRALAQRSSEAARDIGGLITHSSTEVVRGVERVREAGGALDRILTAATSVAAAVGEIATASTEQANGIDEMSQAVSHLDEMTQQNAALAEQSSASAESLSQRIDGLARLASEFRTGEEVPAQQRGRPQPAPAPRAALRPAPRLAAARRG